MRTHLYESKKQLVEEYGFDVRDGKVWHKSDTGRWAELKEADLYTPHPYGIGKLYKGYAFYHNNKTHIIPVAAFNYLWYVGDIPQGMEVDHIDNNTLNNDISNLQLLSHRDNINKRMESGNNQYSAVDNLLKSIPEDLDKLDKFNPEQLAIAKLEADMARLEYLVIKLKNKKRKVDFIKLKSVYTNIMENL